MVAYHSARLGGVLAAILVLFPASLSFGDEAAQNPKRLHIGYRILKVPRPGEEALTLALWHPTEAGPGRMTYSVVGSEMVSDATPNAPPARGRFPLLIYSHGGGGCAIMGATHAEALAENGFIVAGDFANISIPVMIVFGEEETVVLGDPNSGSKLAGMLANYESANPPKFLVEIRGARHLDFGGAGVSRREKGRAAAFSTADVRNNDRVIGTVNHYCIAFFRRYLLGDSAAEDALKTSGPNLVLLKHDTRAR